MSETRGTKEDANGVGRLIVTGAVTLAVATGVRGCAAEAHDVHIERGDDTAVSRTIDVVDNLGDAAVGVGRQLYRTYNSVSSE